MESNHRHEDFQSFANRGLVAANISASAIFRVIEAWHPTLLIDEADTFLNGKDDLRGVINSGHTKSGAYVIRNAEIDGEWQPVQFSTWTPTVIAMIKKPPSTIIDRSIMIELQRKTPDETTERLPIDQGANKKRIKTELMQWANDTANHLKHSNPDVPKLPSDRAMDNWTPLIAVADRIGWNDIARQSMQVLNLDSEDDKAIETRLLEDIREAFGDSERLFSSELVEILVSDEDNIWCEWKHGRPMTANSLARLLKPYKIHSKDIRRLSKVKKGYERAQFEDAFTRYLTITPDSKRDNATTAQPRALEPIQTATNTDSVAFTNPPQALVQSHCSGVADKNTLSGEVIVESKAKVSL